MTTVDLVLTPYQAFDKDNFLPIAAQKAGFDVSDIQDFKIIHKSVDARGRDITINLKISLFTGFEKPQNIAENYHYQNVENSPEVVVVGAGPAGLFAALRLVELGYKPIVLERGKNVHDRKRDIAALSTKNILDENSNYCFGEGGAGTFSDGKLYTRSNKRGNISRILEIFYIHGANENILYESRPHIGTDKLPRIVENMREKIIACGGKVLFQTRVEDFEFSGENLTSVVDQNGNKIPCRAVILAAGHSAEDVYLMLDKKGVKLESKGFAMGVRVEHPRELIDELQYKNADTQYLPAATYTLTAQADGRGVYSFCMCPGGQIVPSATAKNQTVVNGMSASARNNVYSNSGIVVELRPEDYVSFGDDALAGLRFQKNVEYLAHVNGNSTQSAPAQRLDDFVKGRISSILPETSYVPGTIISPVHFWLPDIIGKRLQEGFKQFDKKMRGFVTSEAQVLAVESRTSSPVRIVRDSETLSSVTFVNLFPCGEGAGYAGGIVSSAMDGENAAESVAKFITKS